jgi:hypothetical protein
LPIRERRPPVPAFFVFGRIEPVDPREGDDFSSKGHPSPAFCLSVIFSKNRRPLFRIKL